MKATAAGFPFIVTLVPSRLVGSLPLTISVEGFHGLESPAGARLVPKMATQPPDAIGPPALKLAPPTIALTAGAGPPPGGVVVPPPGSANLETVPLKPVPPAEGVP